MRIRSVLLHRCAAVAFSAATSFGPCGFATPAGATDLPRRDQVVRSDLYEQPARPYAPVDPGPASESGYYGYYGDDILGVPYGGLYSANVACLRSVWTPQGYRTVNVC